jgi:DNA polymerase-3 subunit gamma/tau
VIFSLYYVGLVQEKAMSLASTGADVTLELAQQVLGTAASLSVVELIEAMLDEKAGAGLAVINQALDMGSDPRQYGRQVVDTLRAVLMVKMGNAEQVEATIDEAKKFKELADRFELPRLLKAIRVFDQAAQHTNVGWQPGLQLELALARAIEPDKEEQLTDGGHKASRPQTAFVNPEKKNFPGSTPRPDKKEIARKESQPENQVRHVDPFEKKPEVDSKTQPENAGGADAIHEKWREIRYKAKDISPQTGALLNSCRSVELAKGKLVLGFSTEVLCSKMENGSNIENTRAAVKAVTGMDIPVECRVAAEGSARQHEDPDVEKGGMVGAALSLGAKITKKEKSEE